MNAHINTHQKTQKYTHRTRMTDADPPCSLTCISKQQHNTSQNKNKTKQANTKTKQNNTKQNKIKKQNKNKNKTKQNNTTQHKTKQHKTNQKQNSTDPLCSLARKCRSFGRRGPEAQPSPPDTLGLLGVYSSA